MQRGSGLLLLLLCVGCARPTAAPVHAVQRADAPPAPTLAAAADEPRVPTFAELADAASLPDAAPPLLAAGDSDDAPLVHDPDDEGIHIEPSDELIAAYLAAKANKLAGDGESDDADDSPPASSIDKPAAALSTSALLKLSNADVSRRVKHDLSSLGPMSVGKTNAGALVNGVQMPKGPHWISMDPGHTWGTQETVDALRHCITKVNQRFPDTHKLRLGHISAKHGGPLRPHKSHQSGRDVDIGYYYKQGSKVRWYRRANAKNLDRARTWAFVRAMLTDTDVEFIFINSSIQKLLKQHALSIGEDRAWLDSVFQYKSKHPWPLIRHVRGHDTHIHVRFYNPVAQEMAYRAHNGLARRGIIKPATHYVRHRARRGDLLGNLAKRYKTSVRAIKRLNKLRDNRIRAGRVYLIPKKVKRDVRKAHKVSIPARRLPPSTPLPSISSKAPSISSKVSGGSAPTPGS